MEINDGQRGLTQDQKKFMWSHIQNSHPDLFEKLLNEYSKKEYIPKEKKVSIRHRFKM